MIAKKPVKRVRIIRRKIVEPEPIRVETPYVAPSTWARLWNWIMGR